MQLTPQELQRKITARDAFNHKFCVRGQRRIWEAHMVTTSNIPYEVFVRDGVSVQTLLDTGNPYALRLVKLVLGKDDG